MACETHHSSAVGSDQREEIRSDAGRDQRPAGQPDEVHVQFHSVCLTVCSPPNPFTESTSLRRRLIGLLAPGFSRGLQMSRSPSTAPLLPVRQARGALRGAARAARTSGGRRPERPKKDRSPGNWRGRSLPQSIAGKGPPAQKASGPPLSRRPACQTPPLLEIHVPVHQHRLLRRVRDADGRGRRVRVLVQRPFRRRGPGARRGPR